ncbi:hypothetical protein ACA910_017485 [Epithemia clementina (nom. ined.)]
MDFPKKKTSFTVRRDSLGSLEIPTQQHFLVTTRSSSHYELDTTGGAAAATFSSSWSGQPPTLTTMRTTSSMANNDNREMQHADNEEEEDDHKANHIPSLTYTTDESDVWRAHNALEHYQQRGQFWNVDKLKSIRRYYVIAMTGILQGCVAYFVNLGSSALIEWKFDTAQAWLQQGHIGRAGVFFVATQLFLALCATLFVWWVPMSAGSGIPEVKCFLNGIDLPNVGDISTLYAKVLGIMCSVSAGFPVGKEGPMVHSGAVIATVLATHTNLRTPLSSSASFLWHASFRSSAAGANPGATPTSSSGNSSTHNTTLRNDVRVRNMVVCGAAAGVCTAFAAPIGGILFALEEGASYWGPSLTWRTFFCSMMAFTTLLVLNTLGSMFGKVGFNKLFSFGNFIYEQGGFSSFAVYELVGFVAIGALGGLIGAVFNHTNQVLTKWRLKHINPVRHKLRRSLEVLFLSLLISIITFTLPLWVWRTCTPIPRPNMKALTEAQVKSEQVMLKQLVQFTCPEGFYNELASLLVTDPGVAIRHLFHLHEHVFSDGTLLIFFGVYISLAVVVYGIAIPSGLFVPSLLSGAALGRYLGNVLFRVVWAFGRIGGNGSAADARAARVTADALAFSNIYALVGAAAVLGGMARMTISLTVILLECTGNEQYVLPLMLTLMAARLVGQMFNHDLYHIHIHFKRGVHFLEAELKSIPSHHDLTARQIMSDKVVFFRPVEKVGNIVSTLMCCKHSFFPVVDPEDNSVLFGTIGRNELCILLEHRAFGYPASSAKADQGNNHCADEDIVYFQGQSFTPMVQWAELEKSEHPRYPQIQEITRRVLDRNDMDCLMDLRPYANTAPITIQQKASVGRTYELFRTLGMRFLPVVNRYNQVVGTITRADLSPESLAKTVLVQSKKNR